MSKPKETVVSPTNLIGAQGNNFNVSDPNDLFTGAFPPTDPNVGAEPPKPDPALVQQDPVTTPPSDQVPPPGDGAQATDTPPPSTEQPLAGNDQTDAQVDPETPPPAAPKPFWDGLVKDEAEALERVKTYSTLNERLSGTTQRLQTLEQEYEALKATQSFADPTVERLNNYMRSLGKVENVQEALSKYMRLRYTDYSTLGDLDVIRENLQQQGIGGDSIKTYMDSYTLQQEPVKPKIDPENEYAHIQEQNYQTALSQVRMHNQMVMGRLQTDALNARNQITARVQELEKAEGTPASTESLQQAQAMHQQFQEALPVIVQRYQHEIDLGSGNKFTFELGPNERAAMLRDFQAVGVGAGITAQNVKQVFSNYVSQRYLPNILRTYAAKVKSELQQKQVADLHNPKPIGQGGSVSPAQTNEQKEQAKVDAFFGSF